MRTRTSLLWAISAYLMITPIWADESPKQEASVAAKAALEARVEKAKGKPSKPPSQVIKRKLRTNVKKPQPIPHK